MPDRSAETGKYVDADEAKANPATTVHETDRGVLARPSGYRVDVELTNGAIIVAEAPDHWRRPVPFPDNPALLEIAPGHFVAGHLLVEVVYTYNAVGTPE